MKKKKISYNELMERNDFLLSRLMEVERAVNYVHMLTVNYIACNNHEDKLKKYLEKEAKNGQANGSSPETNRTNQSGDNKTVSQSSKPGSPDITQRSENSTQSHKPTSK